MQHKWLVLAKTAALPKKMPNKRKLRRHQLPKPRLLPLQHLQHPKAIANSAASA